MLNAVKLRGFQIEVLSDGLSEVLCYSVNKPHGRFRLHLSLILSAKPYRVDIPQKFVKDTLIGLIILPMEIMTDKMTSHLKIKGIIVLMDYFDLINTSRNNINHNKVGVYLHINKLILFAMEVYTAQSVF